MEGLIHGGAYFRNFTVLKENNEIINYKKDEGGYIEIIKMNSCFASTKNTTIERCVDRYAFCTFLEKVSNIKK